MELKKKRGVGGGVIGIGGRRWRMEDRVEKEGDRFILHCIMCQNMANLR